MIALGLCILLATAILGGKGAEQSTAPADTGAGQPQTADVTFASARGTNIHATVTVPGGTDPVPLVVMCHGFTGNRNGDGHFQPLADSLAQNGVASIRMDFAGCGESEEASTAYTLESLYDDIDSAIAYMGANYAIDSQKIGLLGHSMGGRAVSLHLNDAIAAAALWSPADNDGLNGLEFVNRDAAGRDALKAQIDADGSMELSDWNTTISAEFVDQMDSSHPWDTIRGYHGQLLIAFTGADPDILSQETIDGTIAAAQEGGMPLTDLSALFANATHNYAAISGDTAESSQFNELLVSKTSEFFVSALTGKTQEG
jgi:dienelactone hydrolase